MGNIEKTRNSLENSKWKFIPAAFISSLAACLGGLLFLTPMQYSVSTLDGYIKSFFLMLTISLPIATLVIFIFAVPTIALLRYFNLKKKSHHIIVFHIIIGVCFFMLATSIFSNTRIIDWLIVPVAATPAGYVFHFFTLKRSIQPLGRSLLILAIVWVIALCMFSFSYFWPDGPRPLFGHLQYSVYHPLADKNIVIQAWNKRGFLCFSLLGFTAFTALFLTRRLASIIFAASLAIPVGILAWYFIIPRGPEIIPFKIGKNAIAVDWKLKPTFNGGVLRFDAKGLGPYEIIGSRTSNSSLAISAPSSPLDENSARIIIKGDFFPSPVGLNCKTSTDTKNPMLLCINRRTDNQILTLISCKRSLCFHQFDYGELRVGLHYRGDNWKKWREIERSTIKLLSEKSIARR